MANETAKLETENEPTLLIVLGIAAILGCVIFVTAVVVADLIVPDNSWIADTISDLGAGRMEYIVDIGLYAYSGALISLAILAAHGHMGGARWSVAIVFLALLGLIVFLIGARNEYGDNDNDGVVIHIYLVYVLGALMAVIPWLMAKGAARAGQGYGRTLTGISILWTLSAPFFFFIPDDIDGIYERYLGLISIAFVLTMATLFIRRGRGLAERGSAQQMA